MSEPNSVCVAGKEALVRDLDEELDFFLENISQEGICPYLLAKGRKGCCGRIYSRLNHEIPEEARVEASAIRGGLSICIGSYGFCSEFNGKGEWGRRQDDCRYSR